MLGRKRIGTFFAVVRLDGAEINADRVIVKEIVSTEAEAIAEVDRLNALRSDGYSRYVWQATRHVTAADPLAPDS